MAIRVRTAAGLPPSFGFRIRGGGGGVSFRSSSGPVTSPGGPLNPLTLLTDGTPLLFTIDSSIAAEYREFEELSTGYYGKYATFVCPAIPPGHVLRIRFGIQTDLVDYLDTYAYLFEGSTFVLGSETLVGYDDDGGSGDYDVFENTLLELPSGALTPGQSYILELTTYGDGDTGNVKVVADVVAS